MVAPPGDAATLDSVVRLAVYRRIVDEGSPPTVSEIASGLGITTSEIETSLKRLADDRVLVLTPGTSSIWMASPFSRDPDSVRGRGRSTPVLRQLHLGRARISVCLKTDGRIRTSCPDCAEPLLLDVREGALDAPADRMIHFEVPAARWWDDIGST